MYLKTASDRLDIRLLTDPFHEGQYTYLLLGTTQPLYNINVQSSLALFRSSVHNFWVCSLSKTNHAPATCTDVAKRCILMKCPNIGSLYSCHSQQPEPYIDMYVAVGELPDNILQMLSHNHKKHFSRSASDRAVGDMADRTRKLLQAYFRPWNTRLADLLQDDKFLWTDVSWQADIML